MLRCPGCRRVHGPVSEGRRGLPPEDLWRAEGLLHRIQEGMRRLPDEIQPGGPLDYHVEPVDPRALVRTRRPRPTPLRPSRGLSKNPVFPRRAIRAVRCPGMVSVPVGNGDRRERGRRIGHRPGRPVLRRTLLRLREEQDRAGEPPPVVGIRIRGPPGGIPDPQPPPGIANEGTLERPETKRSPLVDGPPVREIHGRAGSDVRPRARNRHRAVRSVKQRTGGSHRTDAPGLPRCTIGMRGFDLFFVSNTTRATDDKQPQNETRGSPFLRYTIHRTGWMKKQPAPVAILFVFPNFLILVYVCIIQQNRTDKNRGVAWCFAL
mmetsp:Transcript_19574/g.40376  ORF Transcript_19574/g.40376 Transcript_19574/m.40376 type:complete len:320 (+) Transcript_19574:463-1422(+)